MNQHFKISRSQVPIVKERRRFTDVLDEEAAIKYERKMEAWGRDDFSVYKPARMLGGGPGEGEETTQEVTSFHPPYLSRRHEYLDEVVALVIHYL